MKQITLTLLTGSILASSLLLSGCGESTTSVNTPQDTSKLIRGVSIETDWTWEVGTDGRQNGNNVGFTTYFMKGIPSEVKHFQYFLDTDNNAATGFSFGKDSWRISGADILVEDGSVYKSESTSEWKWSYVGQLDTYNKSSVEGIQNIDFTANKSLLQISSDKVNVTIEPFDANWGSTYSTISTQVVPLVKEESGNSDKTAKEILENRFQQSGAGLGAFVYTPQHQGAVVIKTTEQGSTLSLYGLENPQNPLHEYDIAVAIDRSTRFSDIKMLGNGKIQYVQTDDNGSEKHTYTIIYDYFHKTEVSKTEIGDNSSNISTIKKDRFYTVRTSPELENSFKNEQSIIKNIIIDERVNAGWPSPGSALKLFDIIKIDISHYLVAYKLNTHEPFYYTSIFDINNKKNTVTFESWKEEAGGTPIIIDIDKKTVSFQISYSLTSEKFDFIINYATGKILSRVDVFKTKIVDVSKVFHTGIGNNSSNAMIVDEIGDNSSNVITIKKDSINTMSKAPEEVENIIKNIIIDERVNAGWHSPEAIIHFNGIRKIDTSHYLVAYILDAHDARYRVRIFNIVSKKSTVHLASMTASSGGTQINSDLIIDTDKKTVSYQNSISFISNHLNMITNYDTGEEIARFSD